MSLLEKIFPRRKAGSTLFVKIFKEKATTFDYYEAIITALLEIHPEIKEHPAVKAYYQRCQEFIAKYGKEFEGEMRERY